MYIIQSKIHPYHTPSRILHIDITKQKKPQETQEIERKREGEGGRERKRERAIHLQSNYTFALMGRRYLL